MLPDASWVKMPVAATGPTAGMDPVVVNPNLPAVEAVEQAALRPGTTMKMDHIINARILVVFMEFLLCERQFDIPLRAGSNLQNRHPGKEISRWCYVINLARAQSRASLLFRSSKSLNSVEGRQPCCS